MQSSEFRVQSEGIEEEEEEEGEEKRRSLLLALRSVVYGTRSRVPCPSYVREASPT